MYTAPVTGLEPHTDRRSASKDSHASIDSCHPLFVQIQRAYRTEIAGQDCRGP